MTRITAMALNTYREAVRTRLLLGVFAVSLAACGYSLLVAELSLGNEARVIADLGAWSFSAFGVLVAVIIGSTSLYRELEHKTIFPLLSRPIRRWEYLLGKYLGAVLTVAVFIALDAATVLAMLAMETGAGSRVAWTLAGLGGGGLAVLAIAWLRSPLSARIFIVIPWAVALAAAAWVLAGSAPEERQLVAASAVLAVCEVSVVAALATLFASFSSPFLTAAFTVMLFVLGRSADTLAHIPARALGAGWSAMGRAIARVVPNLQIYVPPRPLLLGEVSGQPVWSYVGWAALHAVFYATVLLVGGALAFRKRDFA
jgi:hypothetical protein